MVVAPQASRRRERSKQNKLDRITAAAREHFSEHGVDGVATRQIAGKADIRYQRNQKAGRSPGLRPTSAHFMPQKVRAYADLHPS